VGGDSSPCAPLVTVPVASLKMSQRSPVSNVKKNLNTVTVSKQTRKLSDFPSKRSAKHCCLSVLDGY